MDNASHAPLRDPGRHGGVADDRTVPESVMARSSDPDEVRLSVILPTHNGREHIERQLDALAGQRWDRSWEIILLNNGSTDGTRDLLTQWVDRMPVPTRVVDADEHLSLSYARNAGVDAARGRSVAFCDDDDIVESGWVAAIGDALEVHPFVASAFEYAALNDPVVAAARGSFQTRELGSVFGMPVASGGGSGCRRSLWEKLGGNSLDFFTSAEDLDFSLRVTRDGGVKPILCGDAVYHVRLRSGFRASFSQAWRFAESSVALYRVHGNSFQARREPTRRTIRRWLGLVWRLPQLLSEQGRLAWSWQLGYRLGRVRGSIRERVWYP